MAAICRACNVEAEKWKTNKTNVEMAICRAYDVGSRK
jgi:hypothetical protein